MSTTANDVVNVALRRIGAVRVNDYAQDTSKEAEVARDLIDEARRDLLGLHSWNFATARALLVDSGVDTAFGWDITYDLPGDFIHAVSVHPSDDDTTSIPYKLEFINDTNVPKRVLLCNATVVYLRYVFDLTDYSVMSPGFRDVMALRLARDFAIAIALDESMAEKLETAFQRKLSRVKARDGIEDWPEQMPSGSWVDTRFGGRGFPVNTG